MKLVVGATGALGGMVTRGLLERGGAVRILVRPGSDASALIAMGAEPVAGDLKDPASLARACAGIETVVTTANSAQRGGADTVDTVEIEGNRKLIDAAKAAGVGRFLFVSAFGASEDSPVPFMRGKALAERHLRESGLSYTILQPNMFMESWVAMLVLMPLQAGGPVTLVGEARSRHAMISIEDVAAFVLATVDHPAARNRTLPLGGPEAVSFRDAAAACERALGRPVELRFVAPGEPLPGLPAEVAQFAAAFEQYDSVIPMEETARAFGVSLTSIDTFARRALGAEVLPSA